MKTIEFNETELNVLIQLLDISVKAQGLNVAEAAVMLAKKVQTAAQSPEISEPFFAEPTVVPDEEILDENSEEKV